MISSLSSCIDDVLDRSFRGDVLGSEYVAIFFSQRLPFVVVVVVVFLGLSDLLTARSLRFHG